MDKLESNVYFEECSEPFILRSSSVGFYSKILLTDKEKELIKKAQKK